MHLSGGRAAGRIGLIETYELDRGTAQLVNLSSRLTVGAGAATGIAGFVVSGTTPQTLLIRGIGPALGRFGVERPLADPVLRIGNSSGTVVATNDNWGVTNAAAIAGATAAVGAFALTLGSNDAAVLVTLLPDSYTAAVSDANGSSGVALIEVYVVP